MIEARKFIETGFSADDAKILDQQIIPLFEKGEKVSVDFQGIKIFTALFFNNVFAKYILKVGPQKYKESFAIQNLTPLGQTTYQHSYDNAVRYYELNESEKRVQDKIVESPE